MSKRMNSAKMAATRKARETAKRQEVVDSLNAQVAAGTLTIRQMTPEERARYGPPKNRSKAEGKAAFRDF